MKSAILLLLGAMSSVSSIQHICGCKPGEIVCASNYVTYNSLCDMTCGPDGYTRHVLYFGPCKQDATLRLSKPLCGCIPVGPEVCASDGNTYPNECEMHCGDFARTRYIVHIGPCKPLTFYKKKHDLRCLRQPYLGRIPVGPAVCASNGEEVTALSLLGHGYRNCTQRHQYLR